jgi:hypothetical protein
MSTAAVFLDIETALDTTWQFTLLYKLSKFNFSISLIKLIRSFLSQRKFIVVVEDEITTARDIQTGVPKGTVLSPTLCSTYINDNPQTPGVCLALYADDTCTYAVDRKEGHVLNKLQRGLNSHETWCERCNIKINEDNTLIDLDWLKLILH